VFLRLGKVLNYQIEIWKMREQTMIIVFRADLETSKLFLENYVSSETYKHEMFSMNYGSFFLLVFVLQVHDHSQHCFSEIYFPQTPSLHQIGQNSSKLDCPREDELVKSKRSRNCCFSVTNGGDGRSEGEARK